MNLIIRGHIRKSFLNKRLYNLIHKISENRELHIYIHTWNVFQSERSWRRIVSDERSVDESAVRDYFDGLDVSIRSVKVEDERDVEIKGEKEGSIGHTPCPVLGYKYMFHGMLSAAESVLGDSGPDEMVVQTRFDILSNWARLKEERIVEFFDIAPSKRIQFMMDEVADESTVGIDNIYMARAKDMRDFLKHMLDDLDEINLKHKSKMHVGHQEWLTMLEAVDFFDR
jgi:hypothetical protein